MSEKFSILFVISNIMSLKKGKFLLVGGRQAGVRNRHPML